MDKELERFVSDRKLVSYKVEKWIEITSKTEVSEIIGFSRPTLDRRLSEHNWKLKEIKLILKKMPF
jgi:hypothetical protein